MGLFDNFADFATRGGMPPQAGVGSAGGLNYLAALAPFLAAMQFGGAGGGNVVAPGGGGSPAMPAVQAPAVNAPAVSAPLVGQAGQTPPAATLPSPDMAKPAVGAGYVEQMRPLLGAMVPGNGGVGVSGPMRFGDSGLWR